MTAATPFLCGQHRHGLIPRVQHPGETRRLAEDIRRSRASYFETLQGHVEEALAACTPAAQPEEPSYGEIRRVLDASPELHALNLARSALQDRLWNHVRSAIDADRNRLEALHDQHLEGEGELHLDRNLAIPAHQRRTDIHRMPGGYLDGQETADVTAGALYDHGVFLYGLGWLGPLNDDLGHTVIHRVLRRHYPHCEPRRILDLGCSVGHSTLPYAATFPEARIWGIDLGASLLRHAIVRARLLGRRVCFAQQNAENTAFPDRSFDLVVSHILLHEIPGAARRRVFAESHRLLAPGGVMIHLDSRTFLQPPSLPSRYFRDTEVWANAEPYLASSRFEEFTTYALEAGFAPGAFAIHPAASHAASQRQAGPSAAGAARKAPESWVAFCGVRS